MKILSCFEFVSNDINYEFSDQVKNIIKDDSCDKLYYLTCDDKMLFMGKDFSVDTDKIKFLSDIYLNKKCSFEIYDVTDYLEKLFTLQKKLSLSQGEDISEILESGNEELKKSVFVNNLLLLSRACNSLIENYALNNKVEKNILFNTLSFILSRVLVMHYVNGILSNDIIENYNETKNCIKDAK